MIGLTSLPRHFRRSVQPRFASDIRFITIRQFGDLQREYFAERLNEPGLSAPLEVGNKEQDDPFAAYHWLIEHPKQFQVVNNALTKNAFECAAGGINNQKQVGLFHLHYGSVRRIRSKALDCKQKLMAIAQTTNPLHSLVMGTMIDEKFKSHDGADKVPGLGKGIVADGSLASGLVGLFYRITGKMPSYFVGQSNQTTSVFYIGQDPKHAERKDTWFVTLFPRIIQSIDDIYNAYRHIHISDEDHVYMGMPEERLPEMDKTKLNHAPLRIRKS